jgi:hypothetical protein
MCRPIRPWSLHGDAVCLIHNPWASRAYDCELTTLPRWVANDDRFEKLDGLSVGNLLGLPGDWLDAG